MGILERKIVHGMTTMCSHIVYPQFVLPHHKHAEYEIMLFTQGSGKQFVGEGVADYKEGDIALIGSNVPHLHLCNTKLNTSANTIRSAGEAIQFLPNIFPANLESIPDYQQIGSLLQKSQYGMRFYEKGLFEELKFMFQELDKVEYTSRLVALFQILNKLYQCKRIELLSETAFNNSNPFFEENEPVNKVFAYLFNHFKEKITLQQVATYVKQNPSALCRYFKKRTDKSIFQCLAEIRIEHACKLLSYSNLRISEIAYESGYNNVPYFTMQFEKMIKRTPSEYRLQLKL